MAQPFTQAQIQSSSSSTAPSLSAHHAHRVALSPLDARSRPGTTISAPRGKSVLTAESVIYWW